MRESDAGDHRVSDVASKRGALVRGGGRSGFRQVTTLCRYLRVLPARFLLRARQPSVCIPAVGSFVLDEATCPCRLKICYHRLEAVSFVPGRSTLGALRCPFRSWSGTGPPLVETVSGAPLCSYIRTTRPVQIGGLPSVRTARSQHHLASGRKRHLRPPVSGFGSRTGTRCGYQQVDIGRSNRSSRCRTTVQQVSACQGISRIVHKEVLR